MGWINPRKRDRGGKRQTNKERIVIVAYNIREGRSDGLLLTAGALVHTNADVTVVQVVKLKDPKLSSRTVFRFTIHTTTAVPRIARGLTLLVVREDGSFGADEVKMWGPNLLSFELHAGGTGERGALTL